jgi:hypothetical protein
VQVHTGREAGGREQSQPTGDHTAHDGAWDDRGRGWQHRAAPADGQAYEGREQEQQKYDYGHGAS